MWYELAQDVKTLAAVAGDDLRRRWLSNHLPMPPTTINLLVNDICNSRCEMCNIWQQKRDEELSPKQLTGILDDPLYRKVEYVGVSGGEPTLRKDLPELFTVICESLSTLKGVGIITNAIRDKDVIDRIEASAGQCRRHGKDFNVMVSLDGVGPVHDQVRGREGNFASAIRVIHDVQDRLRLPLSVGCTITKSNLWHCDELLDYCRDQGIYARFRVAEFIQRLYNFGQISYIRGFDDDEAYHLAMFFTRLEREYETRDAVKRTYHNIAGMLMGEKRKTACPYQDRAVVLDCRGKLQYCAPHSATIGHSLEESSTRIYHEQIAERKRIHKQHCSTCIHDYHAPITLREQVNSLTEKYARRAMSLRNSLRLSNRLPVMPSQAAITKHPRILITGWYGTETVGDKAILAGIIHDYRRHNPDTRITVASLYPFVTERTLRELDIKAQVLPVYSPGFFQSCAEHDEVVMGGGPLMDINELGVILAAFAIAAANGKRRVVHGCGVGPLKDVFCIEAVKRILSLADVVKLRDSASIECARQLTGRTDMQHIGDPAAGYVSMHEGQLSVTAIQPVLACFLRQWPAGYRGNHSVEDFEQLRDAFEYSLGTQIRHTCQALGLRPALYSMHSFFEGNDDRRFNRSFAKQYLHGLDPFVDSKPASVDSIIQTMRSATACLTMRFHSVLFAQTLNRPYLAIDYTLGGKIKGYLSDHGRLDRRLSMTDVAAGSSELLTSGYLAQGITPAGVGKGVAA